MVSSKLVCHLWCNVNNIVLFQIVLEPGATGRFLGLLVALSPAAFSLSGIELIAMCVAQLPFL